MSVLKTKIIQHLQALLDQRIEESNQAIEAAKESRNNDTKSSAGDKYETGRAMMQIEIDKSEFQRGKALALKADLERVEATKKFSKAEFGSLVMTNHEHYFLAIGVGKLEVEGVKYYAISMASPIGAMLQGKSIGGQTEFQGRTLIITHIE